MNHEEEILQLLREIKDVQQQHHTEWKNTVKMAEKQQQLAVADVRRTKRNATIVFLVLILVLVVGYLFPFLSWKTNLSLPSDLSEISDFYPDTRVFDGQYQIDSKISFQSIYTKMETTNQKQEKNLQEILRFSIERFDNFRIKQGVITSGKKLIQEFRLTKAKIDGNTLEGKAMWHEDINDPGDYAIVNVRMELKGRVLRFYYFPQGEPMGNPIIFQKKGLYNIH